MPIDYMPQQVPQCRKAKPPRNPFQAKQLTGSSGKIHGGQRCKCCGTPGKK